MIYFTPKFCFYIYKNQYFRTYIEFKNSWSYSSKFLDPGRNNHLVLSIYYMNYMISEFIAYYILFVRKLIEHENLLIQVNISLYVQT